MSKGERSQNIGKETNKYLKRKKKIARIEHGPKAVDISNSLLKISEKDSGLLL